MPPPRPLCPRASASREGCCGRNGDDDPCAPGLLCRIRPGLAYFWITIDSVSHPTMKHDFGVNPEICPSLSG